MSKILQKNKRFTFVFPLKDEKKSVCGFTIIETMIAISLFLVVVVVGMGSLLNANLLHKKSQDMRSVIDNLSFIMEDISRNLRTGYDYHCSNSLSGLSTPLSCSNGGVIAFKSTSGNQWVYKIESIDGGTTFNLSKSVNGGINWTQLNLSEIKLSSLSGFSVTGAEPSPGDTRQPFATIKLIGTITEKNNIVTPFSLQTSISERLIDIVMPVASIVETPCQTVCTGTLSNNSGDYNMGYKFTVNANGQISALWIKVHDTKNHVVRLYDSGGTELANATITGILDTWVPGSITPVTVNSGNSYVVAVRMGTGSTSFDRVSLAMPITTNNITINDSRYILASDNMPNSPNTNLMDGMVDITFQKE